MGLDLFDRLRRHAADRPGGDAVRVIGPEAERHPPVTWRGLHARTFAVAQRIDTRLAPDAVVILLSANRPAVVPAFLGTLAAGRTVFPVDPHLTRAELLPLAERVGVAAVITDPGRFGDFAGLDVVCLDLDVVTAEPAMRATLDTADSGDRGGLRLQSSGTTGGPKVVVRSGRSLDAVARNVAEAVGLMGDDRVAAAVPLSHSYGIENGLLAPLWAGAAALHHVTPAGATQGRGFDPAAVLDSGATFLPGVPAMFEMIDRLGLGRGGLRAAYSAGGPMPAALARRLHERTGLRLGQLYGSTEVGSVTFTPHLPGAPPEGVGRAMRGVSVRILDPDRPDPDAPLPPGEVGHVAVRAPSMFDRYLDADATAEAVVGGYFLTGDLGRMSAAGDLEVTGRLKLLIDVGGVKVNPIEVEAVLGGHPQVAECVVVPDPVTPTVNRVKAIVTAHGDGVDEAELRSFLRQRLAAHKVPRRFELRATLPKSATGKVLRRRLRVPA
ncbi:MAG: class I adenylate-forming enzyme family protein [Planctomycetota bacterium]